jgi:nicotinamidase-related amidase
MKRLDDLKKRFVILAGIETHVCILQTCLDLIGESYIPVIVVDCIGSRKPADRQTAIQRMQSEGALLTTSESVLFELCRVSGTDKFKAISQLVK